jgi:hypothetical protein
MRRLLAILTVLSFAAAGPVVAADAARPMGTLTTAQGTVPLVEAYAVDYLDEEGLGEGPELRILLADRRVDRELLSGPQLTALERAARKGAVRGVLLHLDPKKLNKAPVRGTLLLPPAAPQDTLTHFTVTGEGGGFGSLEVAGNRVSGAARFQSQSAPPAQPYGYEASFKTAVAKDFATARLVGKRAQDSAQAKAVLAFERALRDGDMLTVSSFATPARFAEIDALYLRAGAASFLDQVRAQLPEPQLRPAQIRELAVYGNKAYVLMVDAAGTRTVAALAHQDGTWKVD